MTGPAALFAVLTRQETHVCGWCLEQGYGSLKYLNGSLVLESHDGCMTAAGIYQGAQCCCYERVGDNPACPVHGKKG